MADSKRIRPFILKWEGGYKNDPDDAGGETMEGVTYKTWSSIFGLDCHERFKAMEAEDWAVCTKPFWAAILGDQIVSQRIADLLFDWVWGAGKYHPEHDVEHILNISFGDHLEEDGTFGPKAISALNEAPENDLWSALVTDRYQYIHDCVSARPANQKFLNGWINRMDDLVKFETE